MKSTVIFAIGLVVGCAFGWFVGYIQPRSQATRHALQYMDKVEPEFSGTAIYALSTIPLILSGDTNAAIERLSDPIASYYHFYAVDPGTNEYRIRMRRVIDAMARTNRVVAKSIARETKRDGWQDVWVDGLGTYASLKVERLTNSSTKAEPDGPANGSQPIRSETNRTSSAAGSRR